MCENNLTRIKSKHFILTEKIGLKDISDKNENRKSDISIANEKRLKDIDINYTLIKKLGDKLCKEQS